MNGYNIPYDSSGKEPPGIAVGEPNPGEPIPVEPNGGPGGDVGPLYGVKSVVTPVRGTVILVPYAMTAMAAVNLRSAERPPVQATALSSSPAMPKILPVPASRWKAGNSPRSVAGQKLATLFRQAVI